MKASEKKFKNTFTFERLLRGLLEIYLRKLKDFLYLVPATVGFADYKNHPCPKFETAFHTLALFIKDTHYIRFLPIVTSKEIVSFIDTPVSTVTYESAVHLRQHYIKRKRLYRKISSIYAKPPKPRYHTETAPINGKTHV